MTRLILVGDSTAEEDCMFSGDRVTYISRYITQKAKYAIKCPPTLYTIYVYAIISTPLEMISRQQRLPSTLPPQYMEPSQIPVSVRSTAS